MIEEAGEVRGGAGRVHVVVSDGCVDAGTAVPSDADHVHFGKSQREGKVHIGPGEHDLCLQVADGIGMSSRVQTAAEAARREQ